jgi:Beta-lactamase enzyme family
VWCLFAVVIALFSAGIASASFAEGTPLDRIYVTGMEGGSGGTYGYYVKRVGGNVVQARNENQTYDPASALKILLLAYAVRQIAAGDDSFESPVTVYVYPHSRNSNGNPANPDLCPNPADEIPANATSRDLRSVLSEMMHRSDNRMTRAIELRYGRVNLQNLASTVGMAHTSLRQIFGCANDNGRENSWSLDDAARLYEGIATGTVVPASAVGTLYASMGSLSYGQLSPVVANVIAPEAVSLEIADAVPAFTAAVALRFKGGSYDVCTGSCAADDTVSRDEAGIVTLPFQSPTGQLPTGFVWGSFIEGLDVSCPGFPCAAADRAFTAMDSAVPELLRPVIRAALQTWASLMVISAGPAKYVAGRLKLTARLGTHYGAKHPAGLPVLFVVKSRTVCRATTNAAGVATCTVRTPGRATSYTARFNGGAGLFAATTTGRLPKPPKSDRT